VKITFGFNLKNKEHFGIMMYHKNRLIKAYEKVGCQIKVICTKKLKCLFHVIIDFTDIAQKN